MLIISISQSSLSVNVQGGGDQHSSSASDQEKSKCIRYSSITRRQEDTDTYSTDSLHVNIDDLANLEELKKITQIMTAKEKQNDSYNIIEDTRILNGFRQHSQEILSVLSQSNIQSYLFQYGERDTGRKLLSIAAETGWYEGVLFLLNRDVNINEPDRENRTALMDCLTSTNINIINALVQKRHCNLDIQTRTGHTAAHYAVMMNKVLFFEILIKSGARLDLRNDKGENVLHLIIEYKRKECWKIVKYFYKHHLYGPIYLKHLIHTETSEQKTCLTLAFEHRPYIYFFKEILSYVDRTLIDLESYHSWTKAYKLLRNLFS
ncbi:hypothetical protein I4U23_029081 [Adineta vaga]|nr:hypothetical protein I4U23_029081 [Adineta vaga]